MAGRSFNSSKNTESRKVGSNQDASYQEKTPVSYFIDDNNMNDNSKPSQERFAAYYWFHIGNIKKSEFNSRETITFNV